MAEKALNRYDGLTISKGEWRKLTSGIGMAQPRLGVCFNGALAVLTGTGPPTCMVEGSLYIRHPRPIPGAMTALCEVEPHYAVVVVGSEEGPFSAIMVYGWLLPEAIAHFIGIEVDNPVAHSLALLRELQIRDRAEGRIDRWVRTPEDWPTRDETDAIWRDTA